MRREYSSLAVPWEGKVGTPSTATTLIARWLARELHDGVAQTLTTMLVEMEGLRRSEARLPALRRELERQQESTRHALASLRGLLCELRGEPVVDTSLVEDTRAALVELERSRPVAASMTVGASWPSQLPAHVTYNLRRIIEEAIHNVRRHSDADAVEVWLERRGDVLEVRIVDHVPCGTLRADARSDGMGVRGMQERALLLGGQLRFRATPGGGTTVVVTLPQSAMEAA